MVRSKQLRWVISYRQSHYHPNEQVSERHPLLDDSAYHVPLTTNDEMHDIVGRLNRGTYKIVIPW